MNGNKTNLGFENRPLVDFVSRFSFSSVVYFEKSLKVVMALLCHGQLEEMTARHVVTLETRDFV